MNSQRQHRSMGLRPLLLMTLWVSSPSALTKSKTWNFDKDKLQALSSGWLSKHTGRGIAGSWLVLADSSAPSQPNVLAQTSADNTSYRFPLAIVDNTSYKDLDLGVYFKTISGKEDQGA